MNTFLAAISGNNFVNIIIHLVIIAIVFTILLLIVRKAPLDPEIKKWVVWGVYFLGALMLINWLLGFTGNSFISFGSQF